MATPAKMPPRRVLHDRLGLTGTKYGCEVGQCGYCQPGRSANSTGPVQGRNGARR